MGAVAREPEQTLDEWVADERQEIDGEEIESFEPGVKS